MESEHQLHIRLTGEEYDQLVKLAKKEERSLSSVVRRVLRRAYEAAFRVAAKK